MRQEVRLWQRPFECVACLYVTANTRQRPPRFRVHTLSGLSPCNTSHSWPAHSVGCGYRCGPRHSDARLPRWLSCTHSHTHTDTKTISTPHNITQREYYLPALIAIIAQQGGKSGCIHGQHAPLEARVHLVRFAARRICEELRVPLRRHQQSPIGGDGAAYLNKRNARVVELAR